MPSPPVGSHHDEDGHAASQSSIHSFVFRKVRFLRSSHGISHGHWCQGRELWARSLLLRTEGQHSLAPKYKCHQRVVLYIKQVIKIEKRLFKSNQFLAIKVMTLTWVVLKTQSFRVNSELQRPNIPPLVNNWWQRRQQKAQSRSWL